jgi:hypothetical protein
MRIHVGCGMHNITGFGINDLKLSYFGRYDKDNPHYDTRYSSEFDELTAVMVGFVGGVPPGLWPALLARHTLVFSTLLSMLI